MPRDGSPAEAENPADRPKSKKLGPLAALWPFMRPYRLWLIGALTALLGAAGFTLLLPIATRRVIDLGFEPQNLAYIDQYFLAMLGVAAALALTTAARYYMVTRLGERVIADIRRAVYDRVIGMSPAFFETVKTGETLSRLTTDTTLIQSVVGSTASIALRNIVIFFGGVVLMLVTSPWLTLMVMAVVPLVVAPIIFLGRRVRRLSRESQDKIAESSGVAGETLQAAATVQAFTYEPVARRKFADATEAAFDAAQKRIVTRSELTAAVIFFVFCAIVGVVWVGARSVISGEMSAGELFQFLLYSVFVAGSVGALSEVWGELQRAAGATERLVELLQAESPIQAPAAPLPPAEPARGAIDFDAVSFAYPSRPAENALEDFSLTVKPGETVALVGPSGAGKTTVFQLLLRFYDPTSGTVRLDGIDLSAMAPERLRSRFALVPQEPVIFAASAAENIAFGRQDASRDEIEAAAEAAAAHGFISKLPDGYDTYVGERGVMLSGGQKQRIAIARAILRDAPVLLLDEATSALDAESERLVQDAVERLAASRTTLVIAHRLATVKKADRIVVLDDGMVASQGAHERLVAEDGLYARLARLQFTA